jgi:hypothetical protein
MNKPANERTISSGKIKAHTIGIGNANAAIGNYPGRNIDKSFFCTAREPVLFAPVMKGGQFDTPGRTEHRNGNIALLLLCNQ